jgi:outer membrane protein TolC
MSFRVKACLILLFLVSGVYYHSYSQTYSSQESIMAQATDTVMIKKLVQLAQDNYPKIKWHDTQIRIAEINVNKAKISWLDVLSFSYFRTQNIGGTVHNSYLLNGYQYGVSLNIGQLLQKPGNVKIAKQNLVLSILEKDQYDLALIREVKQKYFVYIQQLASLRIISGAALDAQNNLKSISYKFEKGEETFESYNQALITSGLQSQQRIQAEANLMLAKAELEELIGTKIEYVY